MRRRRRPGRAWTVRAGFVVAVLAAWRWTPAQQPSAGGGYVLGPDEGEVLRRPNGQVIVKVDPRRGSKGMALGTQDLIAGAGIGVHRHEGADEVLRIEQGHGRAVLGDRRVEVGPGTTVFVPRGTWHGVENTGEALHLVWVVTPPGLEGFFRAIGAAPGEPLKQLTPAQMAEIGRQHGTTFQGP
jgi:mannose-6-phosphate isomerase-like protein (cupin superfamily)